MPRRREIQEREVLPDARYGDDLVARLINSVMRKGKKSIAERMVYQAFDIIGERTKESPLPVFHKAIANVKPIIEVKSRRVGGSTYQVPTEIRNRRRVALSMRWLINFALKRPDKSLPTKLAGEIMDAANMRGAAIKKKEDTHKMAEANKAFAHYRW